jgi:hypothetical protein
MRISELFEDRQWEKDEDHNMVNPLPVIQDDHAFELMDAIDEALIKRYPNYEKLTGPAYGKAIQVMRAKYGEVQDVPINKIVSLEKYLNGDHVKALQQGPVKTSSEMPLFYKENNTYYAGDGNHRIVANYLIGRESVKGLVLDSDKILK